MHPQKEAMKSFTVPLSEIDQRDLRVNVFLWVICLLGNSILLPATINFLADFNFAALFQEESFISLVLICLFGGVALLVFVRFFILINTAPYRFFLFRKDRKNGVKVVLQGVVNQKKKAGRFDYPFFKMKIDEEWFDLTKKDWELIEEGQGIQLEILPVSRVVLKVELLQNQRFNFSVN